MIQKNMIIDGHVHISKEACASFVSGNAYLENLLNRLKKTKVGKAVLLSIAPFVSNDFIGQVCRQYPEKFWGFASVDLENIKGSVNKLMRDVKKYGLKGVKIHPRSQKIKLGSKIIAEIIKSAIGLNLPVLIDCFPQFTKDFPIEETFPEKIGDLAQRFPEAKIIMAHAGGYKLWDAFFIAKANPNVYLDFSFSISYFKGSTLEKDLGFILKKLGAKKCIYGSDHPAISLEQGFSDAKQLAGDVGLSLVEQEYFFGRTLLSILR